MVIFQLPLGHGSRQENHGVQRPLRRRRLHLPRPGQQHLRNRFSGQDLPFVGRARGEAQADFLWTRGRCQLSLREFLQTFSIIQGVVWSGLIYLIVELKPLYSGG
jgi:hypothetical protein